MWPHGRPSNLPIIMSPKDLLLALTVVLVWGVNFVVIKVGLHGVPPMLLGALRFALVAFPAVLFVPRPKIALKWLVAYGATISFGQFAFLFSAMYVGMPAGWPRWCCNRRRSLR